VSCPSATFCAAVGNGGLIVTSTDGGVSWTSQVASGGRSDVTLHAVSCASAQNCVAVGDRGEILRMS